jgi:hypothetical protein
MRVDANDDLSGTVSYLRDRVTKIFGGRRAGAVIPGRTAAIEFSSDHGTARAWLGPVEELPHTASDEHATVVRMRDMASWGEQMTERMLTYAQSVQAGRITPEETTTVIAGLQRDQEYWAGQKRYAEASAGRLRDEKTK